MGTNTLRDLDKGNHLMFVYYDKVFKVESQILYSSNVSPLSELFDYGCNEETWIYNQNQFKDKERKNVLMWDKTKQEWVDYTRGDKYYETK